MNRTTALLVAGAAILVAVVALGGLFALRARTAGEGHDAVAAAEGQPPPTRAGRRAKQGKNGLTPEAAEGGGAGFDEPAGPGPIAPEDRPAFAEMRADLRALQAPLDLVVDPEASPADQDAVIAGAIRDRAVRLERMANRAEALAATGDDARAARALLLLRDGHEAMAQFLDEVPAPGYLDADGIAAFDAALAQRSDGQLRKAEEAAARAAGHVDELPADHPLRAR